jgi:hypothetical protein
MIDGCGIVTTMGALAQFSLFTDLIGSAYLPSAIPVIPELLGKQLFVQWGVLDGGPIQGVLTATEAISLRVGY